MTTSAGVSAPFSFNLNPAGPTVNSITPNAGAIGQTITMTLNGSGFVAGSTVVANGTGITIGKVTVVSSTQMTVTLTLGGQTGTRFLLVVVPSSQYVITSTPIYFTVTGASTILGGNTPTEIESASK
jgi:hypothetical protein